MSVSPYLASAAENLLLQFRAIGHDRALRGGPGAELAPGRAGMEIGLAFLAGSFLHRASHIDLAFQGAPPESQRRPRIAGELAGFGAFVIGEKGKAAVVADLQEDRPGPWLAVGIDGREGHRVRLDEAMANRFLEPGVELPDGSGSRSLRRRPRCE